MKKIVTEENYSFLFKKEVLFKYMFPTALIDLRNLKLSFTPKWEGNTMKFTARFSENIDGFEKRVFCKSASFSKSEWIEFEGGDRNKELFNRLTDGKFEQAIDEKNAVEQHEKEQSDIKADGGFFTEERLISLILPFKDKTKISMQGISVYPDVCGQNRIEVTFLEGDERFTRWFSYSPSRWDNMSEGERMCEMLNGLAGEHLYHYDGD